MARTNSSYRLEWRPKARNDLRAIIRYIAADNPARAQSFGQELREKAVLLARHPELGRAGRPGLPDGTRELVVHKNYLIIYRVHRTARVTEILRLKHAAQQTPEA